MKANQEQLKAIESDPYKALRILAPPGSGKTYTLMNRCLYLIDNKHYDPHKIRLCSFNVKAADNIRDHELLSDVNIPNKNISTIHGLCRDIIKGYHTYSDEMISILDNASSIRESEQRQPNLWVEGATGLDLWDLPGHGKVRPDDKLIELCIGLALEETYVNQIDDVGIGHKKFQELKSRLQGNILQQLTTTVKGFIDSYRASVTIGKRFSLNEHNYILQNIADNADFSFEPISFVRTTSDIYQALMHSGNLFDQTDQTIFAYKLLKEKDEILHEAQDKWDILLVDEYQDVDLLQSSIFDLLSGKSKNLNVVGDPNQSIYAFRGAEPEILLSFPERYPDCNSVLLTTNYRSNQRIIDVSSSLIEEDQDEDWQKAISSDPIIDMNAVEFIDDIIISKETREDPGNTVILCRNNREVKQNADKLIESGLPVYKKYRTNEAFILPPEIVKPIYKHLSLSRKEDKSSIDYFEYIEDIAGVGDKKVDRIKKQVEEYTSLGYTGNVVEEVIKNDTSTAKWYEWIQEPKELSDLLESSLLTLTAKLIKNRDKAYSKQIEILCSDIKEYLYSIYEFYGNRLPSMTEIETQSIKVMTAHQCKGLEWDITIVDLFSFQTAERWGKIDEEARLLFVATSRPRKKLYLYGSDTSFPRINRIIESLEDESHSKPDWSKILSDRKHYPLYLQSDQWKEVSQKQKQLTPYCEKCESTEDLEAHHLDYEHIGKGLPTELTSLQTLCRTCHEAEHQTTTPVRVNRETRTREEIFTEILIHNDFYVLHEEPGTHEQIKTYLDFSDLDQIATLLELECSCNEPQIRYNIETFPSTYQYYWYCNDCNIQSNKRGYCSK